MTEPELELDVEVFRSGDYREKGTYHPDDLDAIADDYSVDRHEAPVTLDHAQHGPAHGWVRRVRRLGDRLVATLGKLSPPLRNWLRDGAYRKCSIELYRAFRDTGRPYLKAVSFLGAAAPEVKGLQPPVFSEQPTPDDGDSHGIPQPDDDEAVVQLFSDERVVEEQIEPVQPHVGFDEPATPQSHPSQDAIPPETPPMPFSEEQSHTVEATFASLKKSGRLLPAWERKGLRAFGELLIGLDDRSVAVSNGETNRVQTPWEWFVEFLGSLPESIPFGEYGTPDDEVAFGTDHDWTAGVPVASPRATLCPRSLDLHRGTVRYMNEHPDVKYTDALHQVARHGS